jgi:hypothetical protein
MSTKELICAELDKLDDESLKDLYRVVQTLAQAQGEPRKPGLLARLREVQFDGPEDFSTNLDQYLSGEKRVDGLP